MSPEVTYRYPGSRPFQDTPRDRELFWGRSEESHELLHLTLAENLVVVFASSGLGKSSLICAGLLEPLRQRDFFPMMTRVNDPESGPLHTVYRDIEEAIRRAGVEVLTLPGGRLENECGLALRGGDLAPGKLSEHCCRQRIPLRRFFQEIELWRGNVLLEPVLVIDQFEELFSLQAPGEREELIDQLASLVRDRPPGGLDEEPGGPAVKVLLSLREDWLGSLQELVPKIPDILSNRFRLRPLGKEAAREAIERPAALDAEVVGGRTFSYAPEAVEAILDFLARHRSQGELVPSEEVAPSQLQLICQHLEGLTQKPGHVATVTLDDLGGRREKVPEVLSGVLEDYYDQQTARVAGPTRLRAIRRLCETGLIVSGRRVSSDGVILKQSFGVTDEELRRLTDRHLLRAVPRLDSVYYELSHDTLVGPILASRGKRCQRRNRTLSWALAAALVAAVLFGASGWKGYRAEQLQRAQQQALRGLETALAGDDGDRADPVAFLTEALGETHRIGCREAPGETCREIRGILRQAVDRARETRRVRLDSSDGGGPAGGGGSSGILERHPELGQAATTPLAAVAVDPTGQRIATAGADGTVRLWDRRGEPLTRPWMAHAAGVAAAAFDPRGERLLTSGAGGGMGLWDRAGNPLADPLLNPPGDQALTELRVNALAWSPDGGSVAIGGADGVVRIHDGDGWRPLQSHSKAVLSLAFDRSGERLASGGADGILWLWDLATGESRELFDPQAAEDNRLNAVAFGPGGIVATGGSDKHLRLWRLADGTVRSIHRPTPEGELAKAHDGSVLALAFAPGGRYLASGGRDSAVRVWDLADPAAPRPAAVIEDFKRYVNSVAFAGDGTLVAGSFGATVQVVTGDLAAPAVERLEARQHDLTAVATSADGKRVATGSSDGTLRLWERNGEATFRRSIPPIAKDRRPVGALDFAPDGRSIAAGSADGTIRLWGFDGAPLALPLRGHSDAVAALELARKTLRSGSADGTERIWDLAPSAGLAGAALFQRSCERLGSLGSSDLDRETSDRIRKVLRDVCAMPSTS